MRTLLALGLFAFFGPQLTRGFQGQYSKVTRSRTGCACWWDLEKKLTDPATGEPYDCACCEPEGEQCGYPMHMWCQPKRQPGYRYKHGCRGIGDTLSRVNFLYTLSEMGYPCHWDESRRDCAWCTDIGVQCAWYVDKWSGGANESHCGYYWYPTKARGGPCLGTSQDCRTWNVCDKNAVCVDSGHVLIGTVTRHVCVCNEGFIGNGITCVEEATGEIPSADDNSVTATMKITTEFATSPSPVPDSVRGESEDDMFDDLTTMLDSGTACDGCQETIATCDE